MTNEQRADYIVQLVNDWYGPTAELTEELHKFALKHLTEACDAAAFEKWMPGVGYGAR